MPLSLSKLAARALVGALFAVFVTACADEGVGDPCVPETIPCTEPDVMGNRRCGFSPAESYIESSSVQCRTRLCIVHKLDNKTSGKVPADPAKECSAKASDDERAQGCVTKEEFDQSIFCTCRCGSDSAPPGTEFCACPEGYICDTVLTQGGEGIRGKYCVKPLEKDEP